MIPVEFKVGGQTNAETYPAAAPAPAAITTQPKKTMSEHATTAMESAKKMGITPTTVTGALAVSLCICFGFVFLNSGVDLNRLDTSNLKFWWVGTVFTSIVFLLMFYIVFNTQEYFNKSMIFLLLGTFLALHICLILTQVNLSLGK
jgi:hypothetical protein